MPAYTLAPELDRTQAHMKAIMVAAECQPLVLLHFLRLAPAEERGVTQLLIAQAIFDRLAVTSSQTH
eukprot:6132121-Ditylum_brightwellii.AAC.1